MTQEEFYQRALIAAMQGLLSSIGHGYDEDDLQDEVSYHLIADLAKKYATALTNKLDVPSNPFPENII